MNILTLLGLLTAATVLMLLGVKTILDKCFRENGGVFPLLFGILIILLSWALYLDSLLLIKHYYSVL